MATLARPTTQRALARPRVAALAGRALLYGLLAAVTLVWVAPFVWMLVTSLKPESEIYRYPPVWLPSHPTVEYYTSLATQFALLAWFKNSFVVATVTTLLALVVDALAAYPLGRMRFRGRRAVTILILATFLVPPEIQMVPLFIGLSRLGLSDSYFSLSVPLAANAFGVFLLMQFFQTVPAELEDAAVIDGCTRFGFFGRILIPLSQPALVTVSIFTFVGSWNNLFWPLIVTNSDATRTLPVGLASLVAGAGLGSKEGTLMAAATVATIPAALFFLVLQRYFVKGISTTGLKG
jgi:ABC-type glycerol-3-phosphate transport system permease component